MSDQGTVSTEDTPPVRNAISVVTEENQEPSSPDPKATPPVDDGKGQSSDATATSSENQDDAGGKAPPKRNRRAERERRALRKQIEEATARADTASAENVELRERLDALEAKLDAGPKPVKPKLADYDDPDKFAADYAAWQKSSEPPPAKKPKADPPPKKANTETQPPEELVELNKSGKERFGDEFAEVIGQDDLPLSMHMIEYIFDSDLGPELVMWADENREDAQKIYKLGAVRAVRALEKVEAELQPGDGDRSGTISVKDDDKDETETTGRKVSKADTPPGDGVKTSTTKADGSLNNLSMDDYAARRQADERKRKGLRT